jgi:hypothetical protein
MHPPSGEGALHRSNRQSVVSIARERAAAMKGTMSAPLVALLLAACVGAPFHEGAPAAITAAVGDTLRLERGAVAEVGDEGFRIRFAGIEADSRCPRGVDCIWAGDAEARLVLWLPGEPSTAAVLHTHADSLRQVQHAGYRVTLVDVEPYPAVDGDEVQPIPPDRYVAVLVVSAAGATATRGEHRIHDR